ncbi:hypothetical protein PROFUN_07720 [Planoprotostelium fungivorum]|uniref:Uncharacterized protein n=1 Tax=Planoprotostelium fungivorum TaxID=1890364 RepID=A0A2P6N1D1_9EUKA|nr:hypothetical protein PROFUN_07720 [Planoprotostelium fungivorum]
MVEHSLSMRGAQGSIPWFSTILFVLCDRQAQLSCIQLRQKVLGIRSAALWGLLEYMLTNHFNIKQMYCVSGSGYAAASFIQNVFHDMERGLSYDEALRLWIKVILLTFVWAVFTHVPVFFFEAALNAAIFGRMLRQDA